MWGTKPSSRAWVLAVVLLSTMAGSLLVSVVAAQEEHAPHVSRIRSVLSPPVNIYSVETNDPDGDALSFTWSISEAGACGAFFSSQGGNTSVWQHDDPDACPHEAASHPGTITVVVTDGTFEVTRQYTGGSQPYEPPADEVWDDPHYAPPGGTTTRTGEGSSTDEDGSDGTGADDEGTDPRDAPPPGIYGEELSCGSRNVTGAFQPVQAVYQDDPDFVDKPGKRLVTHGPQSLTAELDMVAAKPTVLSGVEADQWQKIRYRGTVLGFVEVPVEVHFTLTDSQGEQVVYTHDAGLARIRGDCIGNTGFDVQIDTPVGVPAGSFAIAPGPYTITMELVEKVTGYKVPGTAVTLDGEAVEMPHHRVYFSAAFVSNHTAAEAMELVGKARAVAASYATDVSDFFPLAPGQASTVTRPIEHDLRDRLDEVQELCDRPALAGLLFCEENMLRATVETRMRAGGWQMGTEAGSGDGAPSRTVIMIPSEDLVALGWDGAIAFAPGTKGVFTDEEADHWDVAHEIVHTEPRHLWSKDEMTAACDKNYHNTGRFGTGIQVTHSGANQHEAHLRKAGLMGAVSASKDYWIEQCTYWHLLTALQNEVDPPLFMIRGVVTDGPEGQHAFFDPGFSLDGSPDLTEDSRGDYSLVLKDADGGELARYAFDLTFHDDEERPLSAVSFGFGVARADGTATIALEGPDGTLATQAVSANRPQVTIQAPADGTPLATEAPGPIALTWQGQDQDPGNLSYTVVVSPDGGDRWYDLVVDTDATQATVPAAFLEGQGDKVLRVTASDGVWSAVDEVVLDAPEPADQDRTGTEPGTSETPLLAPLLLVSVLATAALARRR